MLQDEGGALGFQRLPVEPGRRLPGIEGWARSRIEGVGGVVEVGSVAPGKDGVRSKVLGDLREIVERAGHRLQWHEEVFGHRHDFAQVEPAERARRELADVEIVLFVGVCGRLVVAVDDRCIPRDRGQPGDDVEIGHALGTARVARIGLRVIVHDPPAQSAASPPSTARSASSRPGGRSVVSRASWLVNRHQPDVEATKTAARRNHEMVPQARPDPDERGCAGTEASAISGRLADGADVRGPRETPASLQTTWTRRDRCPKRPDGEGHHGRGRGP
jgi:hypothetical protein